MDKKQTNKTEKVKKKGQEKAQKERTVVWWENKNLILIDFVISPIFIHHRPHGQKNKRFLYPSHLTLLRVTFSVA